MSTRKRAPSRPPLTITPSRKRQLGPLMSSTKKLSPNNEEKTMTREITALQITKRVATFFDERAVQQPCISARLFACYSLHMELNQMMNATAEERTNTRHSHTSKYIDPILPFLQSLVKVELESFGDDILPHKIIHFCGFDCSSTLPPVDRIDGSDLHQQESIQALVNAKEQVLALEQAAECCSHSDASNSTSSVKLCLEYLIQFFKQVFLGENGQPILTECAKSIELEYPPKRIQKAVRHTLTELETVLARLNNGDNNSNHSVLAFERRLAEFVGQAIRYHLRMLFNVAPPRLSPLDEQYEKRAESFSKVYYKVEMKLRGENSAAGDGCIAALISKALEYIYCYVGREHILDMSGARPLEMIPVLFCSKPATNRSVSIRGDPTTITAEDMVEIESDIAEATSFLAAASGCRFLYNLFGIPEVRKEISDQGGWGDVETYAAMFWKYKLWELCPEDAHLVALANYDALFAKLGSYVNAMEPHVKSCEENLAAVAKRYRTKTKSENLLHKYPQIRVIDAQLEEGLKEAHFLPSVKAA